MKELLLAFEWPVKTWSLSKVAGALGKQNIKLSKMSLMYKIIFIFLRACVIGESLPQYDQLMNSKTRFTAINDSESSPVIKILSAIRSILGLSVSDLIEMYESKLATKKRMIGRITHSSRMVTLALSPTFI